MNRTAMKEFLPVAAKVSSAERLITTLFFAVLVHGMIILGITFSGEEPPSNTGSTLEITLVQTSRSDIPDEADYLANQSQRGSGNTDEKVRPESAMSSPDDLALEGLPDAGELENRLADQSGSEEPDTLASEPRQTEAEEQLLTSAESSRQAPSEAQAPARTQERLLVARLMTPGLDITEPVNDTSQRPQAHSDSPREKFIAVNTRESVYAEYLDKWRRRIEEIGNTDYPQVLRDKQGSLVMEVALNADGTIRDLVVKRRSPYPAMDAAALDILRSASPFPPFTAAMRDESDVLRFVYEWRFGVDGASSTVRARR